MDDSDDSTGSGGVYASMWAPRGQAHPQDMPVSLPLERDNMHPAGPSNKVIDLMCRDLSIFLIVYDRMDCSLTSVSMIVG